MRSILFYVLVTISVSVTLLLQLNCVNYDAIFFSLKGDVIEVVLSLKLQRSVHTFQGYQICYFISCSRNLTSIVLYIGMYVSGGEGFYYFLLILLLF